MKKFIMLTFLSLLIPAAAETLQLKDGSTIEAKKIEKKGDNYEVELAGQKLQFKGELKQEKSGSKDELRPHYFDASNKSKKLPYKDLIKEVGEAVITVVRNEGGLGSGFIIHPEGYVITNNHVISDSYKGGLIIKSYKKEKGLLVTEVFKKVRVLAKNDRYDLALLKIDDHPGRSYPFVRLARSHKVEQGDEVVAIGSPRGMERSVTKGYVSLSKRVKEQQRLFQVIYIQHTAEINPGNSGGPLFNMKGEVIGVNSLGGGDGMGFAITADCLRYFLNHLDTYKLSARNMTSAYQYLPVPGAQQETAEPKGKTEAKTKGKSIESAKE